MTWGRLAPQGRTGKQAVAPPNGMWGKEASEGQRNKTSPTCVSKPSAFFIHMGNNDCILNDTRLWFQLKWVISPRKAHRQRPHSRLPQLWSAASGPTKAGLWECDDDFIPRQEVRESGGEGKMRMYVPGTLMVLDPWMMAPGRTGMWLRPVNHTLTSTAEPPTLTAETPEDSETLAWILLGQLVILYLARMESRLPCPPSTHHNDCYIRKRGHEARSIVFSTDIHRG